VPALRIPAGLGSLADELGMNQPDLLMAVGKRGHDGLLLGWWAKQARLWLRTKETWLSSSIVELGSLSLS
jgi:hypothetical protein